MSLPASAQLAATNLFTTAYPAADAKQFLGTTNTVRGRVAQVTARATLTFLNLDKPFPDMPLSGVIFANRTNQFGDLDRLKGKLVLITGPITEYNGRPQIIIDSTNQLEVVDEADGPVLAESNGAKELAAPASSLPGDATRPVEIVAAQTEIPGRAREVGASLAPWFIAGSLAAIAALLGWLVVTFRRSGLGAPQLPRPMAALALPPAGTPADAGQGLISEKALSGLGAGTLADPEAQALREKVVSELTEYAKQRLVQGLYTQRKDLAETQQKAQQQLVELEARLAALHLPMKERIQAYEQRIVELEKDLETRDDEMRELVHATLLLVRERLEMTKEQGSGRFKVPE